METIHNDTLGEQRLHHTVPQQLLPENPEGIKFDKREYHFFSRSTSSVEWDKIPCYGQVDYIDGTDLIINIQDIAGSLCSFPFIGNPLSTASSGLGYLIETLSQIYTINDVPFLRDFLYSKEFLVYSLIETHSIIHEIFSRKFDDIILEVVSDPEEDYFGISINICVSISSDKALDLLHEFDDRWWLEVAPEVRKLVTIDIAL